ncbi:CBP4-domain-containing protein [Metschnikowia bicuspidata var. bicuspidata NRRL YB-4993]|uniref:Cytochrome b mRNA-processing protein 4 n=1 Tax=Metschnikowia bicuspidata var. bicuspidata NRRL YB-4993 TaxID=869754 RepID=A0A1A0HHN9_9ASCO|nr:CBP4-domain-containing protein [Metschnikowia bicuspidata var. bicuspidata NRRL YB-4993]OBA23674.1 CBP4-domain-containing protein [Metschnikowia bicuspidata var. bicuspidata NRRL YB-4993]
MAIGGLSLQKWARMWGAGISIVGTGVLLFKYTVPTDEELIARFSPEIRAEYERNKALRQKEQEELMKIVQETSKSNDPIWKTGRLPSPFEKDTRGADPNLVDLKEFHRDLELAKKKQEIDLANAEFLETEKLVAQSKKLWFSWR